MIGMEEVTPQPLPLLLRKMIILARQHTLNSHICVRLGEEWGKYLVEEWKASVRGYFVVKPQTFWN